MRVLGAHRELDGQGLARLVAAPPHGIVRSG
jgi:hypothetical protein